MASLDGVHAKLDRAEENVTVLETEVRDFLESDPQPIGITKGVLNPADDWHYFYGIIEREPPPRLGTIIGDFLHDARSALDHLVWQLVLLNGEQPTGGPRGNAYPVARDETQWSTACGSQLQGVSSKHQATIRLTQPVEAETPERTYLDWLRHLSDVDKHQVIHPTFAVLNDPAGRGGFRVTQGPGKVVHAQFRNARVDHGEPMARAKVEPLAEDTEVDTYGGFPVGIAFGEPELGLEALRPLLEACRIIVREFQPAFAAGT